MIKVQTKKQREKEIALVLVFTLISILLLELALHAMYRLRNEMWLWEQNSEFRIGYTESVEDRRQYILRAGYSNKETGIVVNEYGFRSSLSSDHDGSVIVSLGVSVPFGAGVRNDESYPAILDHLLANSTDSEIRVLNAGVSSYNMRQSYDHLMYDVFKIL